jgi:hypothetical protein
MATRSWLDEAFLKSKTQVANIGTDLPLRRRINLTGGIFGVDNPGGDSTDLYISASAVASISTIANYTQPEIGSTVSVSVDSSALLFAGQPIFIAGGGFYVVTAVPGPQTITVRNLGYYDSVIAGVPVPTTSRVGPGGPVPTRLPPLYTTPYLYYPLNEGVSPGGTYANQGSGGSGFNLTVAGSNDLSWATPSPAGYAFTNGVPGTSGSLTTGSVNLGSAATTNHTIEAIFRRNDSQTTRSIFNSSGVALNTGSNQINYVTSHLSPTQSLTTASTFVNPAGIWQHVMGTCDGITARLYIDGELAQTGALTGGVLSNVNSVITVCQNRLSVFRVAFYGSTLPQSYARQVVRALNMWP